MVADLIKRLKAERRKRRERQIKLAVLDAINRGELDAAIQARLSVSGRIMFGRVNPR